MLYSLALLCDSCPCPELVSAEREEEGIRPCSLVAVNCIHTIYKLLHQHVPVISTLFSKPGLAAVIDITNEPPVLHSPSMDELMMQPKYHGQLTHRLLDCHKTGMYGVGAFLSECFDSSDHDHDIVSLVLCRISQSMSCIRFRLPAGNIYLVMDPHVRSSHPEGPAFLLSNDLADVVHYIDDAFGINSIPGDFRSHRDVKIYAIQSLLLFQKLDEKDFTFPSHDALAPLHFLSSQISTEPLNSLADSITHNPWAAPYSQSPFSPSSSSSPSRSDSSPDHLSSPSPPSSFEVKMPGDWVWEDEAHIQLQTEDIPGSVLGTSSEGNLGWLFAALGSMQSESTAVAGTSNNSNSRLLLSWDHQLALQLQEEELDGASDRGGVQFPFLGVNHDGVGVGPSRRNAQEHVSFLEEIVRRRGSTTFRTLDLPAPEPTCNSAECGICHEVHPIADISCLSGCSHSFCNECLSQFVKSKLQDGRYPIFCPECHVDRSRSRKTQIDHGIIEQLGLEKGLLERLSELQLISHSVVLHCPRCSHGMSVDREALQVESIVICPISTCGQHWCRSCSKQVSSSATKHRCKHIGIDRLMRRKGWKYCPGCRTPIQKESGCNHITCGAPGCNVHFCYKCSVLIIDTKNGGDVGTAVTDHYVTCQLFEKRFKCSIQ